MSKDILERRLRDQIDEWNEEIGQLEAKAKDGGPDTIAECEKRVAELKEEIKAAMHKLEELRRGGGPGFQTNAENWGEGL